MLIFDLKYTKKVCLGLSKVKYVKPLKKWQRFISAAGCQNSKYSRECLNIIRYYFLNSVPLFFVFF